MATVSETVHVKGIRCERCVARLGHVLKGHQGLESANATLAGAMSASASILATSSGVVVCHGHEGASGRGKFRGPTGAPRSSVHSAQRNTFRRITDAPPLALKGCLAEKLRHDVPDQ